MRFGQSGGAGVGEDGILHSMSAIGGDNWSSGGAVAGRLLFGRWRRRDRAELAGWGISLAVHLVVFALLWSLTWTIRQPDRQERLIIPEARLARTDAAPIRTVEQVPKLRTDQEQVDQPQYVPQPQEQELSWRREAPLDSQLKIIGIGTGGGFPLLGQGLDAGSSQAGPKTGLFGSGGNAYRICYVIDRSGSMLESFEYVRQELKNSIRQLVPQQRFHVIFFSAGEPVENPPGRLVRATTEAKARVFKFLDLIVPAGRTDPTRALEKAFTLFPRPELIYLMTDGEFDRDVLEKLRVWNPRGEVRINTIAFLYEVGAPLLKQIAREHGGKYKFVSVDDMEQ
jgi:hypothetical protein